MAENLEEGVSDCNMYDITVFDIHPEVKISNVEKHFKCFGTIKDFKAFQTVAFIKFEDPKIVKRVLALVPRGKVHILGQLKLSARKFEFWDQSLYTDTGKAVSTLLEFTEVVLDKIFSFLEPNDHFNFAKSHPKFMDYLKSLKKYQISSINLDQEFFKDLTTLKNFLDCFGPEIQAVVTSDSGNCSKFAILFPRITQDCLKLVTETCTNLTKVKFFKRRFGRQEMHLLCSLTEITELSLEYCLLNEHSLPVRPINEIFQFSPNRFYEEILLSFKKLKHLSIRGAYRLEPNSFIAFCKNNPQLITLDIRQCGELNEKLFSVLVSNCKKIETLKVSFVTDEILIMFEELKSLSELDISRCNEFSSESFLYLLRESPQLKCVSLKDCGKIEREFLLKAIEVLKEQTGFLANDQNILDRIRKDPDVLKNLIG